MIPPIYKCSNVKEATKAPSDFAAVDRTDGYSTQIADEFVSIREDQTFCDFNIRVDDHLFPCHRIILAANSIILKTMLMAGMRETQEKEVDLSNISKEVMQHLLDYMYTGKANIPANLLISTIEACEYLQMLKLKEKCLYMAPIFFTPNNALYWYDLAIRFSIEKLNLQCREFISANFADISKEQEFLSLSIEEITDLIRSVSLTRVRSDHILHEAFERVTTFMWASQSGTFYMPAEMLSASRMESDNQSAQRVRQLIRDYLNLQHDAIFDQLNDVLTEWVKTEPEDRCARDTQMCINAYLESASILKSDYLLDAVVAWIRHDWNDRVANILQLLNKVDLENVSPQCLQHHLNTNATLKEYNKDAYNVMKKMCRFDNSREVLVLIGGVYGVNRTETFSDLCWYLTPSNQLKELCQIPQDCSNTYFSVCKTPVGFALTGGFESDVCAMFNMDDKSWSKLPKMLNKRCFHASIFINGLLYVFGGSFPCCVDKDVCECDSVTSDNDVASVNILHMKDDSWIEGPSLPIVVAKPIVAEIESTIFLLDLDTCQLFGHNTMSNTWCSHAALPFAENKVWSPDSSEDEDFDCYGVSMTSTAGQLVVAGGFDSIFAMYTPSTDTWCLASTPNLKHPWGSVTSMDDKVYVLGGEGTDQIEEYDATMCEWQISEFKMPLTGLKNSHALTLTIKE